MDSRRTPPSKRARSGRRPGSPAANAIGLLGLLLVAVPGCSGERAVSERGYSCPNCNLVLISMDTLRADHVGAYGYERSVTPNIDALAARGVLFENAVAQSSWTRPSHLSMFTGLYPNEHGVRALVDRQRLPADIPTVASELARAGLRTAAFTGGVNVSAEFGFDSGFEIYRTNGKYFADNLGALREWLDDNGDERFFLFLHGYDAHTPYLNEPEDREALSLEKKPPRRGVRPVCKRSDSERRVRAFVDEYDAAIRRGDRNIGIVVEELRRRRLLDRTVIVFTSDHGEEFLEHGRCFHLTTLYREVLHVPLIIAGPGLERGRRSRLVPASVSVAPTLLAVAGVHEHRLPGQSLLAADADVDSLPFVVSETERRARNGRGQGHLRSLTTDSEKLLHRVTDGNYERFDLSSDPAELEPVTAGGRLEILVTRLERWLSEHPPQVHSDRARASNDLQNSELDRQLRRLGYRD